MQDLRAINTMIRMGDSKMVTSHKRSLEVDHDEESLESPAKQACVPGHPFIRRLQDVSLDRQELEAKSIAS